VGAEARCEKVDRSTSPETLGRVSSEPEDGHVTKESQKKRHGPRWSWPLGLLAAGAGGAAIFLFRGCWHTKMGWPMREGDHSYQVCLGCGIKRLFDETKFRGYGPYGYEVKELIARERAVRMRQRHKDD
jgi:hypothetical protein